MKASTLLGAAVILAAACSAQANLVVNNEAFTGGTIPDGNPAGFTTALTVSGVTDVGAIANVVVTLDISGGYNGDLYGYLAYQTAGGGGTVMSVLLNRPGLGTMGGGPALQYFGYADAGMNVTLDDETPLTSINNYGGTSLRSGVPTGSYNSAGGTLNTAFSGLATANGTWTLFLADLSAGGGTPDLLGATLTVSEVPEPVTWALIIFGAGAGGVFVVRVAMNLRSAWRGVARTSVRIFLPGRHLLHFNLSRRTYGWFSRESSKLQRI
jgi:hypothetical protein